MTDNFRNASDQRMRYRAPLVKVIEIKSLGVLCGSDPSLTGWSNDGSYSDGGEMGEEGE